jgi:hypothetical protein
MFAMIRDQRRVLPIAWAVAAMLSAAAQGCSSAPAAANASPPVADAGGAAADKPLLTLKGGAQ